jgi:hypothetical protein
LGKILVYIFFENQNDEEELLPFCKKLGYEGTSNSVQFLKDAEKHYMRLKKEGLLVNYDKDMTVSVLKPKEFINSSDFYQLYLESIEYSIDLFDACAEYLHSNCCYQNKHIPPCMICKPSDFPEEKKVEEDDCQDVEEDDCQEDEVEDCQEDDILEIDLSGIDPEFFLNPNYIFD